MKEKAMIGLRLESIGPSLVLPIEKPKLNVKVTEFERHEVLEGDKGQRVFVYRHDLVKPTLTLVGTEQTVGTFTYTYEVSNAEGALESINQIVFIAQDGRVAVRGFDGIAPGTTRRFTVTSDYAPGPVTAIVSNLDQIAESKYLDQFGPSTVDHEFTEAYCALPGKRVDVSVIGPALKPK